MRVVLDINIWCDVAFRKALYPDSGKLFKALNNGAGTLCLPCSGYTTLFYLISKNVSKLAAHDFLDGLEKLGVELLSFGASEVGLARKLRFSDFEDACVAATATQQRCDFIATRNIADFRASPVKAMEPEKLLGLLT